jgi:hypothetical protein
LLPEPAQAPVHWRLHTAAALRRQESLDGLQPFTGAAGTGGHAPGWWNSSAGGYDPAAAWVLLFYLNRLQTNELSAGGLGDH